MKDILFDLKLENFLRKEKVMTKFKKNIVKQRGTNYFASHISRAFIWDESPEGLKFWSALSDKFLNQQKQIENEKN